MTAATIVSIHCPQFSAGVVLDREGKVIRAAPIVKYMIGWSLPEVRAYIVKRGWDTESISIEKTPKVMAWTK